MRRHAGRRRGSAWWPIGAARQELADGGRPVFHGRPRKARPGAVRKTPANKPGLRKLVRVARRAAPRGSERDCGHTITMVAPLGAPSPSLWRGDKRREGRRAYPGPRQTIRMMTLAMRDTYASPSRVALAMIVRQGL